MTFRVLVWPTYSYPGNVGADSLYLIARNLLRQVKEGQWLLVVPDLPTTPVDDLDTNPHVTKVRVKMGSLYRLQEAVPDREVLERFGPHGPDPVDVVLSTSPARLLACADLWGIRQTERDRVGLVLWDLLVRDDGAGEMTAGEPELLLQSAGNAVADLIVHESPVARRMTMDVARKHLSASNVRKIVENSVDVAQGIHVGELMKAIDGVPKREKFAVYYGGRFSTSKRVNDLAEVIDKFYAFGRDVEFVVTTGSLDGNKRAKFVERFPQVELHVGLPQEEAWKVMASCHASICFSSHELFGMAFWEQMAAGLAVVMKTQSWNADLIPPGYPLMCSGAAEAGALLRLAHSEWELQGENKVDWFDGMKSAAWVKEMYDSEFNCQEIVSDTWQLATRVNGAAVARLAGKRTGLSSLIEEATAGMTAMPFETVIDMMRSKSRVGGNVVGHRLKWAKSFGTLETLRMMRLMGWQDESGAKPYLTRGAEGGEGHGQG